VSAYAWVVVVVVGIVNVCIKPSIEVILFVSIETSTSTVSLEGFGKECRFRRLRKCRQFGVES
jgi:hypothetical protein